LFHRSASYCFNTEIAESGHIIAQEQQPIHLSSTTSATKYPALFVTIFEIFKIFMGHTLTHIPHPLQTSGSIIILANSYLL